MRRIGTLVVLLIIPFATVMIDWLILRINTVMIFALAVILIYLLIETLLDFVLKVDFRAKWSTHIPYILLEYGAFFSLIFIASKMGKIELWWVSITFWIAMACLVIFFLGIRKPGRENQ